MYLIKYFSPDGSYPWCCNVTWPAAIHVATRQLLFNYLWSTLMAKAYSHHAGCAALAIKIMKNHHSASRFEYSTGVLM
jgi:hypothetical protein